MRTRRFPLHSGAIAALVVLLAGCSKGGDPTGPGGGGSTLTQDDADDLALQSVIALDPWGPMIEASSGMSAPGAISPAPSGIPTAPRSGFRGDATTGVPVWHDTTFTRGNVTFTLTRRFFDLFGDSQDAYGPTTDSVYATSRVTGSVASPQFDASFGQAGWIGVGGLNPMISVLTISGQSDDTLSTHFTALNVDLERFCESRTSTTLTGIAWPKPSGSPTYPTEGTATIVLAFTRYTDGSRGTIEKSANATVIITFNGTANPTVSVNGTWHYVWNMDTGAVARAGAL
jgi:hypothetical protein